jgi:hypothetical protein
VIPSALDLALSEALTTKKFFPSRKQSSSLVTQNFAFKEGSEAGVLDIFTIPIGQIVKDASP